MKNTTELNQYSSVMKLIRQIICCSQIHLSEFCYKSLNFVVLDPKIILLYQRDRKTEWDF